MTFAVNIVKDLTQEMLPSSVALPSAVHSGISGFHYIYGYWRWFRLGERYMNPDNWFLIAADKGFEYFAGNNRIVQVGAQLLLILTAVNECVTGYIKLYRSYRKLNGAVRGHFPKLEERQWAKSPRSVWISPAFSNRMSTNFNGSAYYVNLVAKRQFKFFRAAFTLCMLQIEAVNAFSLEASKRQEAVGEVFSNAVKFMNQFTDNSALLASKLQKNKVVIQKMLSYVKEGMSADSLISTVETLAKGSEKVSDRMNSVHETASKTFLNVMKDALYGVSHIVGVDDHVRRYFAPEPPEAKNVGCRFGASEEQNERYAPKHHVTRLDKLTEKDKIKNIREQSHRYGSSAKRAHEYFKVFQEIFV